MSTFKIYFFLLTIAGPGLQVSWPEVLQL